MTRILDLLASLFGIILLLPFFVLISILVVMDSGRPVFYIQARVGCQGKIFQLYKFRTMKNESDKKGLLTVGSRDNRITGMGYFLRKYKLDELPQLFNVFIGDMSLVGPRPEVEKYVKLYNESQRKVLSVRPGITDMASILYLNENEILGKSENPEKTYIEEIMPHKLEINLAYLSKRNVLTDLGVILKTVLKIVR